MNRRKRNRPKTLWIAGDGLASYKQRSIGAVDNSPIRGACQWFNPPDIGWMAGFESDHTDIDAVYQSGRSMHMIVWIDPDNNNTAPPYLTSSGTGSFLDDHLPRGVNMFKGANYKGPFYITLFTEFDAVNWEYSLSDTINVFLASVAKIKASAPWAKVGLGLGGYNWPTSAGGTRDLSGYASMFNASDFLCTQIMQDSANISTTLIPQWKNAIAQLGTYNKPVMISHLNMWGADADQLSAWQTFQNACMTDDEWRKYADSHLFAVNLMANNGVYCDTQYQQSQVRHTFETDVGQWHSNVGTITYPSTEAAFAGTRSMKHTYLWTTGESTVTFDNGPRAALNWSTDGPWFGLRIRSPYNLRGLRGRLRAWGNGADHIGEWWTIPNADPFNTSDFFNLTGKFPGAVSNFEYLSLDLYHPNGPGTTESIHVDQWTQGTDVPQWQTGIDFMRKYALR